MKMQDVTDGEYPVVRALTRKDRRKLSELISAFAERSGNVKLTSMVPGLKGDSKGGDKEPSTDEVYGLIKSVMASLLQFMEDELTVWFMDLTGISDREVYDCLPFDIEVHIIDQLLAQKGFNNFFMRASELYKKIRG